MCGFGTFAQLAGPLGLPTAESGDLEGWRRHQALTTLVDRETS